MLYFSLVAPAIVLRARYVMYLCSWQINDDDTHYRWPTEHPLSNSTKYGKISKFCRSHFGRLLLSRGGWYQANSAFDINSFSADVDKSRHEGPCRYCTCWSRL